MVVFYNECQRVAAKRRGAFRSSYLSVYDKYSHEKPTL